MNDLKIFFNTEIVANINTNCLRSIGDFGLTPFRYLFNGTKVHYNNVRVYHVLSFSNEVEVKHREMPGITGFKPSEKHWLKTAAAVLLLIPGLILSLCKLIAYAFPSILKEHYFIRRELYS